MSEKAQHPDYDPRFWLKQAKELDRAAMLLWDAISDNLEKTLTSRLEVGSELTLAEVPFINLGGVFWLNAGFALENLFKGLIIQNQPDAVINGAISKRLRTHNLLKLAKLATVEFDAVEGFYLWVGSMSVRWSGRYPVALTPKEKVASVFSEADIRAYRTLFDRTVKQFDPKYSVNVTFVRLA